MYFLYFKLRNDGSVSKFNMVRVKRKEKLNETVGKMELEAELIAKKAEPGQFVIVRAKEES